MPRPQSKHQLAQQHVEFALSETSQALSKLGGKVRSRSKDLPSPVVHIARQYLEGVINRLRVIQLLLVEKSAETLLRDPFEKNYDKTREVGC